MTDPIDTQPEPSASATDDGVSYAETYAIAEATATHPPEVVLDDAGDPVLDDDGEPVTAQPE